MPGGNAPSNVARSDNDSFRLNGSPVTPPDQGLCVGRDSSLRGGPEAVWEPINLAARETSVTGRRLRPDVSLATLFHVPFATGDVGCLYAPATRSFYFTEIGYPVQTVKPGRQALPTPPPTSS